jgi:hypothetical protein
MRLESKIRELAKSSYWQEIYQSSKECSGINVFDNINNFSGIQFIFLYWLKVYTMLYTELSGQDWQNLDIDVIIDDDRCDAFLYWRRKKIAKQNTKNKAEQKKHTKKGKSSIKTKEFNIYSGASNKDGSK